MKTTLSHPSLSAAPSLFRLLPPEGTLHPALPRIERGERRGPVLQAGPFADNGAVLSLNLGRSLAGDAVLCLFTNTAEQLERELAARPDRLRAVFVSPSLDPFLPRAEVQAETTCVVRVLAAHGVETWLRTRGFLRPETLAALTEHREHVTITLRFSTLDRSLQRVLEPLTAPPELRLRQLARLRERGVRVHVELAPLIPGLTDTRDNLRPLLEALAALGVRQVTAGYLSLRPGPTPNLPASVLASYAGGPMLRSEEGVARHLPKVRRQHGYAALMALAAEHEMNVSVCSLTNPDFGRPRPSGERMPRLGVLARTWEKSVG